jgi:hypothetical protein
MSFTQPLCEDCWEKRFPGRAAVRIRSAQPEICCDCGVSTLSGIYFRVDPATVAYPQEVAEAS